MDEQEARNIIENNTGEFSDEKTEEAAAFLANATCDPSDLFNCAFAMTQRKQNEKALEYAEKAYASGSIKACEMLGYIWYYGRTGKKDFKKAYEYFSEAEKKGSVYSAIKIADMYRFGYYLKSDLKKYRDIVERLYIENSAPDFITDPFPEIAMRLARIRKAQWKTDESVNLYRQAKDFLKQRLKYVKDDYNVNLMKLTVEDMYTMVKPDPSDADIYDLLFVLKKPKDISFEYGGKRYRVSSFSENGSTTVRFNGAFYESISDFILRAKISGKDLTKICDDFDGFRAE